MRPAGDASAAKAAAARDDNLRRGSGSLRYIRRRQPRRVASWTLRVSCSPRRNRSMNANAFSAWNRRSASASSRPSTRPSRPASNQRRTAAASNVSRRAARSASGRDSTMNSAVMAACACRSSPAARSFSIKCSAKLMVACQLSATVRQNWATAAGLPFESRRIVSRCLDRSFQPGNFWRVHGSQCSRDLIG